MCSNAHFHTLVYYIQKLFLQNHNFCVHDNKNIINYQIHEIHRRDVLIFSNTTSLSVSL